MSSGKWRPSCLTLNVLMPFNMMETMSVAGSYELSTNLIDSIDKTSISALDWLYIKRIYVRSFVASWVISFMGPAAQ